MDYGIYHTHSLFLKYLDKHNAQIHSLKFYLRVVLRKMEL